MKRPPFADRPEPRRGQRGWLRQRIDLILGLLVVAAWAVVAVDADRSMRAAQAAAAAPATHVRGSAARAESGTAVPPNPGPAINTGASARS